jgi:cellulose synthase/poly-beta-1,6-N-acetylglucosamine synthase-like glycosyltransferase
VAVIDLDSPVDASAAGEDARYEAVWVLGRRDGRPVGIGRVPVTAGVVTTQRELRAAVRERVRPVVPVAEDDLPGISVVLPTIVQRVEDIRRRLVALDSSRYPRFEVLVVDNRRSVPPDDPLEDALRGLEHVRAVRQAVPGISAARNAGVAAAAHDVVCFTDDDVDVEPTWLLAVGERFARDGDCLR